MGAAARLSAARAVALLPHGGARASAAAAAVAKVARAPRCWS